MKQYPWIKVSMRDGQPHAEGQHSFHIGHEIPRDDGTIDGMYAAWEWDGEQLTVRNDRYGVKSMFYSEHNGTVMVSPSTIQLIAQGVSSELDDRAVATFLRLAFYLGNDTPYKDIKAVPPNATFIWREGKLTVEGKMPSIRPQSMTYDEAIEGYVERFRTAISRRPAVGASACPLSGGRDSRHIFLELCVSGNTPDMAITMRRYSPKPGDDLATAQTVAKELGVPHVAVVPTRSYTAYEAKKNVLTHMCTDEMWWVLPVIEHIEGKINSVWDGLAGGVLSAGDFLTKENHELFVSGDFEGLARYVFRVWSGSEGAIQGILLPEHQDRFSLDLAMDRTIEELKKFDGWASPVTIFYLFNRTRREIGLSPAALYDGIDNVYVPYLDHDVFDYLSSIPAEHLWNHTFHTDSVLRGYPQYAYIPFENRQGAWNMWMAPKQAIYSTFDLYQYAREHAPRWTSIMRRWWWNKLIGRESGGMPRRMIHYMMQLEAMSTREGAQRHLEMYSPKSIESAAPAASTAV